MSTLKESARSRRRLWPVPVALVALAALVMGLPTVRGGFVGGDDHRLAINHVLVNHPSWPHAVKLFTIVHGDLYQPLPLLSFSAEFAVAGALGLFDEGEHAGAWLFHLTNVVLHVVNTVLVWALMVTLGHRVEGLKVEGRKLGAASVASPSDNAGAPLVVATVTALLFAVHPLQTEVVAWTNGRMMLMSTLFALASLLTFALWLERRSPGLALLTVLFVLLSGISKARVGLPVLLLIVIWARRGWHAQAEGAGMSAWCADKHGGAALGHATRRFLWLWLASTVVTGIFVSVNVWSTSEVDLFAHGAEYLRGPRSVRVLLALGCYFQHLVWPAGLASYYPAAPVVKWSDPQTLRAALIVLPGMAALAWACLRSRVARLGALWFFATIASTLPFFPARNILAADRYMYLPIIGLFWLIAVVGYGRYRRWTVAWSPVARRALPVVLTAAIVPPMIGTAWHVASFYETPTAKTTRIAALFPDTPRVWERRGWSLYGEGHFSEAIECAEQELRHGSLKVQSGAYQLLGMSELRLGNAEKALDLLHRAADVDPKNALARYRLAMAYDELGQSAEAVRFYEAAVEVAPMHNPTINRLASVYRRLGRFEKARAMYEKALLNNIYEVPAVMGLAELEIRDATRDSYLSAERRLTALLDWMPENTDALTNLGAVRQALGRTTEAIEAYTEALRTNPGHVTAALNLAQIYYGAGQVKPAWPLFMRAVDGGLESIDQAFVVHDFFVSQGAADRCVALWETFDGRLSDSLDAHAFLAWSYALTGDIPRAETAADGLADDQRTSPLVLATWAYIDLAQGRYGAATARTEALCEMGWTATGTRRRLRSALEHFDLRQPNVPWTFCLTAQLLISEQNLEGANAFARLCEERCDKTSDAPACYEQARRLRSQLSPPGRAATDTMPGPP